MKQRKRKLRLNAVILIMVFGLVAAACGSSDDTTTTAAAAATTTTAATTMATPALLAVDVVSSTAVFTCWNLASRSALSILIGPGYSSSAEPRSEAMLSGSGSSGAPLLPNQMTIPAMAKRAAAEMT